MAKGTLSDEIVSGKFIKTLCEWVDKNTYDLNYLAGHLESPEEDVIIDMLDDILSVWTDAHKKEPCEECEEVK